MKVLLDTCIWGPAQTEIRASGHDVIWAGDWDEDPGDEEILSRAHADDRVLVTLDKDFGELAILRGLPHRGHSDFFNWVEGTDTESWIYDMAIVPPLPGKRPFLEEVLSQEKEALLKADRVFVIGYSLPKTDSEQEELIREAMHSRQTPVRQLILINFNEPTSYFVRMKEIFNASNSNASEVVVWNRGFLEFVTQELVANRTG